jgi:hypothetical protein
MLKNILVLCLTFLFLGSISAQNFIGKINPFPSVSPIASQDTLKILAVMVSFQEDRDGATVGNGKFGSMYSQDYGNSIIDPLPHDRAYFEAHLEFVKNYFEKVSGGMQKISYHVLPDTFSVSQTMRNYSPPPQSNDFKPLADFSTEVWQLADAMYPGFEFSDYDIFTIFHAGVGRDVTLPGSIGTERDLPSLYLGLNSFKNIYGENFAGIPVSGGQFLISNSMIIPETESREVSGFGGTFLFELSINGLLAASVASHLGLPDLFDTQTGLSAIGRFGLMDGQSIFAYGGTFPPEPSPWEKIYLSWATPVTINPGEDKNLTLAANQIAELSDTVILKIPINSSEYFLVENRSRDAFNNGAIITYVLNGDTLTKVFEKDTTGFLSFSIDSLQGVIINVDEFDWAVPGSGIVIWHIDEEIISQNLASNSINNDKSRRGVDVEEADGIQDIGEQFRTIFGDVLIGEGAPEDFWFASNDSELYQNIFSKNSRPNSNSNSGANSLISISNFSEINNYMSFNVSFGDSIIKPLFSNRLNIEAGLNHLNVVEISPSQYYFNILNNSTLYVIDSDGSTIQDTIQNFSEFKTASFGVNNTSFTAGAYDTKINLYSRDLNSDQLITLDAGERITASPVIVKTESNDFQLLIGTQSGKVLIFSLDGIPGNEPVLLQTEQAADIAVKKIAADGSFYAALTNDYIVDKNQFRYNSSSPQTTVSKSSGVQHEQFYDLILTKAKSGEYLIIALYNHNEFLIFSEGNLLNKFTLHSQSDLTAFALSDLKNDGENYLIYPEGNGIEAVNINGSSADNFPYIDKNNIGFGQFILSADIEGDRKAEIISVTTDGRVFALDGGSGKVINGFPISPGKLNSTPVLFNSNGQIALAAIDSANNFSAWIISSTDGKFYFTEKNGNSFNNSFVPAAERSNIISDFFPKNRAYNYPNPVYDGETKIRYFVSENSKINIKIFDLAGDFVAELNDDASGGMDNETTWNVSGIQSGVYLARIEAIGTSGAAEQNIIKIAVVK